MKKWGILGFLLLTGCAGSRYTLVCSNAPPAFDVYGTNTKGCPCRLGGTVVVRKGFWGERTYQMNRCEGLRVVEFKRIKAR